MGMCISVSNLFAFCSGHCKMIRYATVKHLGIRFPDSTSAVSPCRWMKILWPRGCGQFWNLMRGIATGAATL